MRRNAAASRRVPASAWPGRRLSRRGPLPVPSGVDPRRRAGRLPSCPWIGGVADRLLRLRVCAVCPPRVRRAPSRFASLSAVGRDRLQAPAGLDVGALFDKTESERLRRTGGRTIGAILHRNPDLGEFLPRHPQPETLDVQKRGPGRQPWGKVVSLAAWESARRAARLRVRSALAPGSEGARIADGGKRDEPFRRASPATSRGEPRHR